jgi:hypothetical protein
MRRGGRGEEKTGSHDGEGTRETGSSIYCCVDEFYYYLGVIRHFGK